MSGLQVHQTNGMSTPYISEGTLKSLMLFWREMALDRAVWCCTSATMDCKTVQGRYEHEGLSFLTITLPTFGKDLQKGLDQGFVDRNLFQGFKWKGGLPRFLGGFLDRVFDRNTGRLLHDPDVDAIQAVLQLTLGFSKILVECSDARTKSAFTSYMKCEADVKAFDQTLSESLKKDFQRISQMLFRDIFVGMDRDIYNNEGFVPKHGPGATANRVSGNQKYNSMDWTERLEAVFPYTEYLLTSFRDDRILDVDIHEPGSEIPVRVITVPKTLKTPRIIAIEPVHMMYMQQAIMERLVSDLEANHLVSPLIGFSDQIPNQEMAREGSITGTLATLDLSEASDRVSNQHVRAMLQPHHWLASGVEATRSRTADVPGEGVIRLAKFASMGSALCFPMEAMVFLTIIIMGIEDELNRPVTKQDIKSLHGQVRVYGDDIIVPVDYVRSVIAKLEAFGLIVNANKSFWTGKFRESCGKEYFAGQDVSIVKVRRVFPTERRHVQEIISLVSLRNQLYFAGYWRCTKRLDEMVKENIKYFPTVLPTSPVLGRHSFLGYYPERLGPDLHDPQVRGYVIKVKLPSCPLDGYGALLKWFLKRGELPFADRDHLERAGRPRAVDIKPRWASAV